MFLGGAFAGGNLQGKCVKTHLPVEKRPPVLGEPVVYLINLAFLNFDVPCPERSLASYRGELQLYLLKAMKNLNK